MSRKMTVVFHDEDLYTDLKVEAARKHMAASEIISDAVREWLERREDAELLPMIESARTEWKTKGGRSWQEVEQDIDQSITQREGSAEAKRV